MTQLSAWSLLGAAAVALAQPGSAQTIAQRVAAVRQGDVELHYASRPGVCGDGHGMLSINGSIHTSYVERDGFARACVPGPVRVRLHVEEGAVRDVHAYVGPAPSRASDGAATSLGEVPAAAAAAYFLHLAATADGRMSDRAILPAVIADSADVWRALLGVSRDNATRGRATRTNAAIWVSRFAAVKLDGHPNDLAWRGDEERDGDDARGSAVFALSQLRDREGIPPLIQVARTNRDAYLRRQALFWLGQSGDARALDLFEEILAR